jgi:hypothetical protein
MLCRLRTLAGPPGRPYAARLPGYLAVVLKKEVMMRHCDVKEHGGQKNAKLALCFDRVPLDEAHYLGGILLRGRATAK